jgi:hypothetical protein
MSPEEINKKTDPFYQDFLKSFKDHFSIKKVSACEFYKAQQEVYYD